MNLLQKLVLIFKSGGYVDQYLFHIKSVERFTDNMQGEDERCAENVGIKNGPQFHRLDKEKIESLEGELKNANFLVDHYNNSFKVWYERAKKAEGECVSLKEQVEELQEKYSCEYAQAERIGLMYSPEEYKTMKVRAEAVEAQVKRLTEAHTKRDETDIQVWRLKNDAESALSEVRKLKENWIGRVKDDKSTGTMGIWTRVMMQQCAKELEAVLSVNE